MKHQRTQLEKDLLGRIQFALILAVTILGLGVLAAAACQSTGLAKAVSPSPPMASLPASPDAQGSYADVVSRVEPAVVTVTSLRRARAPQQFPFMNDPFFRRFFGNPGQTPQTPPEQRERGLGSGVIVRTDGYILTNHHVIDGAEQIKVELNDHRMLDAKVIGSDAASDLAVLKIDAGNLPVLTLGDSDRTRIGDVVLAVGDPLGIGQTVTMGIISAKGRQTGLSDGSFEDFLQTDAAINQGNSGGALVNTKGELVGINSQILSPSGGSIGLGFAIPANMARNVMDQLVKNGKVRRGKLGITIQSVTSDLATSLGLSEVRGALVSGVESGGRAERAGVKRGDVITAFNGSPVEDSNALRNRVASTQPGTEVTVTVVRDGKQQEIRVTLGELTVTAAKGEESGSQGSPSGKLGMTVEPLTPALASRLNLPSGTTGLVVTALDAVGPAADAGLQQGDVIVEVNRRPVRSETDLNTALASSGSRPALILINRRGSNIYLTLSPHA